ncbi:MAG TPA: MFS transporter [Actinopolymorphaceae bacterium]|nr:MFS transporter [Actinopolymorphaceae bacterium]
MVEQAGGGVPPADVSPASASAPDVAATGVAATGVTATGVTAAPLVPLRRNRAFAFFWTAQVLSFTGSQISELAIPLTAVLVLAASPSQMGFLTAMEALPSLLVGLLLGVVVDRVRRGPLLIWCNLAQAAVVATIPVAAWWGILTLGQLYVVVFVAGSLALGYALAHSAYIPVLVDRRQLATANAGVELSDSVTATIGPGLGGLLVQWLTAPFAVAVDAVSFLVAALLQLWARRPEPPPPTPARLGASLREGLSAFRRHRGVVALTMAKGIPDFFHWGLLALFVLYAVRELHLSAATIGLIAMVGSLGPVLAGAIAAPVSRRYGAAWTSVIATVLFGGAGLLTPIAAGPPWLVVTVVALGQFLGGLGVVYLIIVRATIVQRSVPPHLLGRVGAVIRLIEWGPGPVGGIVGGLLGELVGLRTGLFVLAAGALLGVPWIAVAAARGHLDLEPDEAPSG